MLKTLVNTPIFMKKYLIVSLLGLFVVNANNGVIAQKTVAAAAPKTALAPAVARPKLVVGIVIDQMRWDYLVRYRPLFKANGGLTRLLSQGYSCENTLIPYTPTVTACGHTCAYTGSVPAIHGITGNAWWDNQLMRSVYCSEDKTVKGVGSKTDADGQMSPRNMLTTTIGDELRLATNFKSKVVGVAIKDRGAILPAGHSATAAYWYEGASGNFITSTYYTNQLPSWVNEFNNRKVVDSLYKLAWNTVLPTATYADYATADQKEYESKPLGKDALGFPYDLSKFIGKDYGKISSTPYGNTLTAEMAKAAVVAEKLGQSGNTDMLAVSFSSPDYIGHSFGPNSWENVDDYVRLDEELGSFFTFLDKQVGAGQYTVFLTADHAVAHVPGFMKENKLPGGVVDDAGMQKEMNAQLKAKYGIDNLVVSMYNYQVYLNHNKLDSAKIDDAPIKKWIADFAKKNDAIANAFSTSDIMTTPITKTLREMLANGFNPRRSGDVQLIFKPGFIEGGNTGTTHGLWYPYDAHIPLLWYGFGINKGSTNKETYMTDIAVTLAALLKVQMPSGAVGKVIEEVIKK
jgi:predicted AlkP superfamily pyrophosphatase or phosphodiesterase